MAKVVKKVGMSVTMSPYSKLKLRMLAIQHDMKVSQVLDALLEVTPQPKEYELYKNRLEQKLYAGWSGQLVIADLIKRYKETQEGIKPNEEP